MRTVVIVWVILSAATGSALSEDVGRQAKIPIPYHDVDAVCATYKAKDIVADCVRREQIAYENARYRWQHLTLTRRLEISKQAEQFQSSAAFYRTLSDIVWAETQMQHTEEDRSSPPPKFQR